MRNLIILQDNIQELPWNLTPDLVLSEENQIVDICSVNERDELFILFNNGILVAQSTSKDKYEKLVHEPWDLRLIGADQQQQKQQEEYSLNQWFYVQMIGETSSLICISHAGTICSIQTNRVTESWNDDPEIEGCVDDGIGDAMVSPDQSCLVIVTNNNTLLLMTNSFDLINEVPIETRVPNSPCCISWAGDSLQFALYSVDSVDNIPRVRLYNRDLILLNESRTAADGAGAIVKNLLPWISFAPNGSMIAVGQQKTPKKQQITILERSGLRHGEFEIQNPWLSLYDDQLIFKIISLQFNIETSLLAVGLLALHKDTNLVHSSYVQLYHRNNYHWYLKQQWSGEGLKFGRFDSELSDRLFLTESPKLRNTSSENSSSSFRVRCIELIWDSCTSDSEDCTAAVVDGRKILMTPLGKALVPPPMSLYTLNLPSPSRDISFWHQYPDVCSNNDQGLSWGLACLCDGNILRLWNEDLTSLKPISRGQPNLISEDIDLTAIAIESGLQWCGEVRNIRAVRLDQDSELDSNLAIICVVSLPINSELSNHDIIDKVLVLKKEQLRGESVWRMEEYPILSSASILRLIPWSNEKNCIGIALSSLSEPFEVVKMAIDIEIQFTREFLFSEPCARKLAVVRVNQDDHESKYLCFGLSSTPHSSRFYCCDNLLSSSHVSSFVVNSSLGVVLYVTSTSKPMLHFASIQSLSRIVDDIETNLLAGEAANQPSFTFSAPRPVERGARLVASPLNSATVVLQIPRGNLEGCEPRPLVLMKSRILLEQKKYLECLLLLRRQRVDLNLLVDHNPDSFIAQIPELVPLMVKTNPELLPLLISALENGNISSQKYPLPEIYQGGVAQNLLTQNIPHHNSSSFSFENKVNPVCEHIRNTLYELLSLQSVEMKVDDLLLPLLCSYAKQRPPLLAHALFVVKRYSLDLPLLPRTAPSDFQSSRQLLSQALSSTKAQKCFKYIAFLCDYQELFNAALGECDFDLARAIARQGGQMDPKVYLPLLQKMESLEVQNQSELSNESPILIHLDVYDTTLGTCPKQTNTSYCFMRFRVFVHLNKHESAIDWGLACLESIAKNRASTGTTTSTNDEIDLNQLLTEILTIITQNNIFVPCFPKLRNLRQRILSILTNLPIPTTQNFGGLTLKVKKKTPTFAENHQALLPVTSLLSKVYYAYGQSCYTKGEYSEAISAYLSSSEEMAPRGAVEAAIQNGDWQLALGLGGRYYNPNEHKEHHGDNGDDGDGYENSLFQNSQTLRSLDPKDIARELIDAFRSSIEQGGGEDAASEYYTVFQHNSKLYGNTSGADHAIEASQLCVEYFDDVEGAVGILLSSKRWRSAAQLAARKRRLDLLREEIGSSLKIEVQQVMRVLNERQIKHLELVEKLTALWIDGPGRLKAVSEVDPGLLKAIQGRSNEENDETRSDFGGGTSVYSNISIISSTSTSSISSTLSNLSNLSEMESNPQSIKKKKDVAFAIDGIEHNLLSRGKTDRTEFTQYEHPKLKKRKQKMRSKTEGGGRDIFGLKQEGVMARLLYNLGDITAVSVTVGELCEALLIVGGITFQLLACELQAAMDLYIQTISSSVAPIAPLYPLEWLQKRNMEEIQWFQQTTDNLNPDSVNSNKVWWRQAVNGINLWKTIKRNSLILSLPNDIQTS